MQRRLYGSCFMGKIDRVGSRHFVTGKLHLRTNCILTGCQHSQHLGKVQHAHMPSAVSVERYERSRKQQELKAQGDKSDTESDGNSEGVETEKLHAPVHNMCRGG